MSENKEKRYVTEWSFSFEKLSDQIADFVKSVGAKGEEQIKTEHFEVPLENATSARVRLDLSVGKTTIRPLAESNNVIEADLTYVGDVSFTATGDAEKVVTLSQVSGPGEWFRGFFGWIGSGQKLSWDVGLTARVPMDLEIHNGVGQCRFDLATLQVRTLRVAGGAGEITATLPEGTYTASIDSGVGQTNLSVPPGATVDMRIGAGTGEINLDIAEGADVTANIRGGVGAVNIRLPQTAGARVEYTSGIGGANVSPRLTRIKGGEGWNQSGVWQSPDYDTAEQKVYIRFEGGVGGLTVR